MSILTPLALRTLLAADSELEAWAFSSVVRAFDSYADSVVVRLVAGSGSTSLCYTNQEDNLQKRIVGCGKRSQHAKSNQPIHQV